MGTSKRRFIKWVESGLIILLVTLIANAVMTTLTISDIQKAVKVSDRKIDRQVALITDEATTYETLQFLKGIEEAQKTHGLVVTTQIVDGSEDSIKRAFEIAQLTGCEGIFVKLKQNGIAKDYIQAATEQGIKVVVVDHDVADSRRDAYVGANKLLMGKKAAEMVKKNQKKPISVLVILGDAYSEKPGIALNHYLNGFRQIVEENKEFVSLEVAYTNALPAELILDKALETQQVNTVVCTDPLDTIKVMNLLVDYNRIQDIMLIGSGNLPEITAAVTKKIIPASIVVDYHLMAVETINAFVSLTSRQTQTAYKLIPIEVLE